MAAPALLVRVAATLDDFKRNLAEGVQQIETTKSSMQRMASSYDGSKLIVEANATVVAIKQIGGAAALTADEQRRANVVLETAIEKYRILGKEAPAEMLQLADATGRVSPQINTLQGSLSQFDGVLASVGINIGTEIRGINDLASAAGKTASELGGLATAGLALGAGVTGWHIGRMVSEFFDLDMAIGKVTAKLLGFGDVAGQEAAAKADVLALASQRAGRAITDLSEAMRVNEEWGRRNSDRYQDWAGRLAAAEARVNELTPAMAKQIELAQRMGATQEELEHDFKMSADAMRVFNERMKEGADAGMIWGDGMAAAEAATANFWKEVDRLNEKTLTVEQTLFGMKEMVDLSVSALKPLTELEIATAKGFGSIAFDARFAAQTLESEVIPAVNSTAAALAAAANPALSFSAALDLVRQGKGTLTGTVQSGGPFTASREEIMRAAASGRYYGPVDAFGRPDLSGIQRRASGGPVMANEPYMVGERGPEIFTPRQSGSIIPNGGGTTIVQHFHITQPLGTPREIARVVGDAMMADARAGGLRAPSGA